jgi:hypothetical protein
MTKRRKILDELQECFDFDSPVEAYTALREELTAAPKPPAPPPDAFGYEECCNEIAVAVKKAIRSSGLSREQVVDKVNVFFRWNPEADGRERLTIHMLNNYLCRPAAYNMPLPYLYAIQRITGSLEPLRALAEMEGVKVITREEEAELTLGKIEAALMDIQRAKRALRGRVAGQRTT